MTLDTFVADFKAENDSYYNQGLFDELMLYKWIYDALKTFGSTITEVDTTVVEIKNKQGSLPDNFYSLRIGYWCEPMGYCTKAPDKVLQSSRVWTQRVEYSTEWNACEPCCQELKEKVITEKVYLEDNHSADFYFRTPIPVKLGKVLDRTCIGGDCLNVRIHKSPFEIVIREKTVYSNFDKGYLFMQYYGLPTDEKGLPTIPDGSTGAIGKYVEAYVYTKLFAKIMRNSEAENIAELFKFYVAQERDLRFVAMTDAKATKLTPQSFDKIRIQNRMDMVKHEINFPIV